MKAAWAKARHDAQWSRQRARVARAVVRRAVVEALAEVCGPNPIEWHGPALRLAGEILRRLGLRPIGRDVAAAAVGEALERRWSESAEPKRLTFPREGVHEYCPACHHPLVPNADCPATDCECNHEVEVLEEDE